MRTYRFTIKGNHKSQTGNPMPKLKMTGKQHWTPRAQEYAKWKDHVVGSFFDSIRTAVAPAQSIADMQRLYANNLARYGKPFVLNAIEHAFMSLRIYWSNKAHGDPENIFGSIADALFVNDKNVDVFVLSSKSATKIGGKPAAGVEVVLRVFDNENEKVEFINAINI